MPKAGTMDHYRALEWLSFVATELHKQFTPLFKDGTPGDYRVIAKENVLKAFQHVDEHLAGRQWLVGDRYSIADIYLFVVSNWGRFQDIDVTQWPNLNDLRTRIRARPKVEEAMKAGRADQAGGGVTAGLRRACSCSSGKPKPAFSVPFAGSEERRARRGGPMTCVLRQRLADRHR
jgi:hypothetical protein